ncbi:MAG: rRNA cytosine-C5-methyltransferase [Bacteroidales bacterium]|nr:rRNA cytosine-C5-methyltransferase [Bacteroidales bacterium]MDD3430870.1 rRNA cytosine-C5-methyltransferase [Bacteroidales bacterium]MDD4361612.1 rRNA cytosine-C5-methyltransferase [Bacteroidales bacterium]
MNLDPAFVRQMRRLLPEESDAFMHALEEDLPVSLRLNTAKCTTEEAISCLPASVQGTVPWFPEAFYLEQRPAFIFDPLLHAGMYYVQEASSMFSARAIHAALETMQLSDRAVRMLDLCAAPGGKSTLAASVLPKGSLLLANEIVPSRAKILDENLIKWGTVDVVVTQNEAADFNGLSAAFDLILADMPCSGEGMFRKEPEALVAWSEDYIRSCALRQRNILTQCWNSLRPGGCLIYSTCTYNTLENEENVLWAAEQLGARILPVECHPEWNIHPAIGVDFPAYRFFPHRTKGEGFFLALLLKEEQATANSPVGQEIKQQEDLFKPGRPKGKNKISAGRISGKVVNELIDKKTAAYLSSWFDEPGAYEISLLPQGIYSAFPEQHSEFLAQISSSLHILRAGIYLGEYKGGQFIPNISLALSTALKPEKHFPAYELDRQQALSYLKRESMLLSEQCPRGQVLMSYKGKALGWVNNLGIRANNRYPQSWRIRAELPANTSLI